MTDKQKLDDIEEEITKVTEETVGSDDDIDINFIDFFDELDLFQTTLATLIGVTSANIIRETMRDLVYPIVKRLFFQNVEDKVKVYGIEFELKDMVSNLLFLIIFIVLLYLSVKYLLGRVFRRLIKKKKEAANNQRLTELYKIKLMKENNDLMREMNRNFIGIN